MRLQRIAAIAFTVSCATLASAHTSTPRQTREGFFRPSTDPALSTPVPRAAPRPTEDLVAEDRVQANDAVRQERAPDPAKVIEFTEQQMDRSVQEAQAAQPAPGAPAPINGAFTGSTSERDR